MAIDWEFEHAADDERERLAAAERQREQDEREEERRKAEEARRTAYLADAQRIEADRPRAVELALKLLNKVPEEMHQEVKDAAELSDLETLDRFAEESLTDAERRSAREVQMIHNRVAGLEARTRKREAERQKLFADLYKR
jgi:hypothetical protein